jgi:glycosyltransferase involved in cell wall biosynthesis
MSIDPIKITNSPAPSKRVGFLSFDGLSDALGQSQILPYLCGLAKEGFSVTIFSCEKPLRLAAEKERITERLAQHHIQWQYLIYDEQGNWFTRWQYARQLFNMTRREHQRQAFNLLHCRSYLAALSGKKMHQKFGVPFLFDMRGLWADERRDGGIWKSSHLLQVMLYHYFKFQEKVLLKKASGVISLTRAGLNELCRLYPLAGLSQKTTIIPCCTDTHLFQRNELPSPVLPGLPETSHLLVYTGSIGTWYMTREMLECVLVWRKQIPHLRLLILTRDRSALEKIVATVQLPPDLLIIASAAHHEVPLYLNKARAAIFFIQPAYSKIASSPTKMAECWAMDLPIISNKGIGDGDELFSNNKGGILVDDFSHASYEKACDAYLNSRFEKGALRKIALEHFDNKWAVKSYKQAYLNILSSST